MATTMTKIKKILLGLSLGESDINLVKFAEGLATGLGAKLVLSHAVRPFHYYAYAGEAPVFPLDSYGAIIDELDEGHATKKLEAIQAQLKDPSISEIKLCFDDPAEGLDELAEEIHADLILVGSEYTPDMWQGVSTSISLMKYSKKPVMVVPSQCESFLSKPLNVYCGDDLSDSCQTARQNALMIAEQMNAKEFHHFHIKDMSEGDISRMIEHVRQAAALGKVSGDVALQVETYREKVEEETQKQLRDRLNPSHKNLHIKQDVLFGKVSDSIHKLMAADKKAGKLLVFGKHHIFHSRSFSLGKIPYPTMLQQGVCVLVVPS